MARERHTNHSADRKAEIAKEKKMTMVMTSITCNQHCPFAPSVMNKAGANSHHTRCHNIDDKAKVESTMGGATPAMTMLNNASNKKTDITRWRDNTNTGGKPSEQSKSSTGGGTTSMLAMLSKASEAQRQHSGRDTNTS